MWQSLLQPERRCELHLQMMPQVSRPLRKRTAAKLLRKEDFMEVPRLPLHNADTDSSLKTVLFVCFIKEPAQISKSMMS